MCPTTELEISGPIRGCSCVRKAINQLVGGVREITRGGGGGCLKWRLIGSYERFWIADEWGESGNETTH